MTDSIDLEQLIVQMAVDENYVPGEGAEVPAASAEEADWRAIGEKLKSLAQSQSSASAKSRALSVAALLQLRSGQRQGAKSSLEQATEASPRYVLAVQLLNRLEPGPSPHIEQLLESAAQGCRRNGTQRAIWASLRHRLRAEGRQNELSHLLDRLVRSVAATEAWSVERAVHRLASGQSLAGLELPRAHAPQLSIIAELLRPSAAPPTDDGPFSRELLSLHAARNVQKGNIRAALPSIRRAFSAEPWLTTLESSASLLDRAPALNTESAAAASAHQEVPSTLEGRSAESPRRRALRSLERNDREGARAVLAETVSGDGTLTLAERALLSAWTGHPLQLRREEAVAAWDEWPALAIALYDPLAPVLRADSASASAQWLELGARIARSPELSILLDEDAQSSEEGRVDAPEMVAARDFVMAIRNAESDEILETAGPIRTLLKVSSPSPIEAFLAAQSRKKKLSAQLLEEAVAKDKSLALAAFHIAPPDHELPSRDASRSSLLSFLFAVERAFRGEAPALGLGAWCQSALESTDFRNSAWSAGLAWLAWAAHIANRDGSGGRLEPSQMTAYLAGLVSGDEAVKTLVRGSHWRDFTTGTSPPAWTDAWVCSAMDWLTPGAAPLSEKQAALAWPRNVRTLLNFFSGHLDALPARPKEGELDSTSERCLAELDAWAAKLGDESARFRAERYWNSLAFGAEASDADGAPPKSMKLRAYERLAELEELIRGRGSGVLWRRALAEEFPDHLPSLFRLEELSLDGGAFWPLVEQLAHRLPPADRDAAQLAAGAHAFAEGDFRKTRRLLEPLLHSSSSSLFVLRTLQCLARDTRDDELLERCLAGLQRLATREEHKAQDLDLAAIGGELALVRLRQGASAAASQALTEALEARCDAFPLAHLDCVARPASDPAHRAEQVELLAEIAKAPSHALQLWRETADLWRALRDEERAAKADRKVLALAPGDETAFESLLAFCERCEDWDALRSLLQSRLTQGPATGAQQLRLELKLADVLVQLRQLEEAKEHLEVGLKLAPEDTRALKLHAEISVGLGAHASAERSLVQLRDCLTDREERLDVTRNLAEIYWCHLGQLEKAMDAYQELLANAPHDRHAQTQLVEIYSRLGLAERATSLQTKLIQEAKTPEDKRKGALELARIYEEVGGDPARAAATLERTRKAWPLDADVLQASIEFMDRRDSGGPRAFILDRVGKDARRHLAGSHIDPALLDTLGRVARLSLSPDEALACFHARAAYLGEESEALQPSDLQVLNPKVEDSLAPRGLSAPLRRLLRKTGAAMDSAFSVDLGALGARPLLEGRTATRVKEMAEAMGRSTVELFVSSQIGARCLSLSSRPPRLLVGAKIEDLPSLSRDYLLMRGFKLQQMGAGALARSRDEDRWPLLAALLHLFSPHWQPPTVDLRKVAKAQALLEQGLARSGYDDDLPMLALEAIGALGGEVDGLGDAPRLLANRVGLVGVGSLSAVFEAMAAGEGKRVAPSGPSRFRWIESHAEARDLLLFMTTPTFTEARVALGLAEGRRKAQPAASPVMPTTGSGGASTASRATEPPTPPVRGERSRLPAPPPRPQPSAPAPLDRQGWKDDETS